MCRAEESSPLLTEQKKVKNYDGKESENTTEREEEAAQTQDARDWRVVAAAMFALFILNGAEYGFGCLMEPLMLATGLSRSSVSLMGSTQVALSAFTAPLASAMISRLGMRRVSIIGSLLASLGLFSASFSSTSLFSLISSLSVMTGTGFGLMYMAGMVAVAEANTGHWRPLALGLCLCGPAVGNVLLAPAMAWVTASLGWRACLQGVSGLCLVSVASAWVYRKNNSQQTNSDGLDEDDIGDTHHRPWLAWITGEKLSQHKHVYVFLLLIVADFFSVMALFIPYGYIQPIAALRSLSPSQVSMLVSAIGVGSIAGRLTSSVLAMRPQVRPLSMIRAAIGLAIPLPLLLTVVDEFWMFCLVCLVFGFLTGIWIAGTSPFLASLLGMTNMSAALGLLTFAQGAACLVSPPLAGLVVESSGDALVALYMCGACLLTSATLYTGAVTTHERRNAKLIIYDRFYTEI